MLPRSTTLPASGAQLALCYIRQSCTRDDALMNSSDRQTANILTVCEQQGWAPVWFVEPEGHRSAYREEHRPEWRRLKEWLHNPQVVAVVANDPSRLYRKMWRMGSFLEELDACHLQLLFAAPGSPVRDIRNPADRFILQMYALMDENYVHDMARRQKDSIAFRHRQGKTTGIPPFGVLRNAQGYLMPSPWGAWVFADGHAVTGQLHEEPCTQDAEWRGYYDCAYRILTLYAHGDVGRTKVARQLDSEGWRFRDRWGQPRRLDEDDIRRVVSNWAEYGGMVGDHRAKDREVNLSQPAAIPFVPERAVMPLDLLGQVVTVLQTRSIQPGQEHHLQRREGLALTGLCYCAHCATSPTPRRTRLGTCQAVEVPVYRHCATATCTTTIHSIPAETLEREVGRLIDVLIPDEVSWQALIQPVATAGVDDTAARQQTERALAMCEERFARAKQLYLALEIDEAEFRTHQAQYRHDLAQLRTVSTAFSAPLAYCRAKLVLLQTAWQSGTIAEQRTLIDGLFEDIGVDLDTGRITAFRLKPWLQDYVRVTIAVRPGATAVTLSDTELSQTVVARLYPPSIGPAPLPARVLQQARNAAMHRRYTDGETLSDLARCFGLSPQRIHQIIHGHRK